MKMRKLLATLGIILVVLVSGCKKDEYQAKVGVCPEVVSTIPADKAVNVPLNQVLSATFNEKMDPAMFTQETVSFTGTTTIAGTKAATTVTGTIVFSGMTVFFTPTSPLLPNTTYTGRIKAGVKDLMGNALQTDYVWSFSTDVSPTVSADPINNAVDVPLSKVIVATFSVPMDTLTLKAPTTIAVTQGTTVVPGKYSFTATTASFKPDLPLTPFTVYKTTITTAAKNKLGTPMTADYVSSFTTIPQISVSALPVLGGTVAGGGTFAQGSSVTLTAVPNVGYAFTNWTDGATVVSSSASYQLNMAGNKTLVANFAMNTYTLNVTAVNGTVLKVPNTATYNSGASVVLTPTPATGFVFTSWSGDATGTANPLTVTMNANKNITANFTAIVSTFTLNVTAVNGTVAKLPNTATYNSGATVVLTPTPATGFVFSSWSGDATGTANPLTVTMNANKNITANFTAIVGGPFTLNVTAVNGTVVKNPDQVNYNNGVTVQLTATPATGYVFTSWNGDATGAVNPVTVTMNSNKSVTANFTLITVFSPVVDLKSAGRFGILAGVGVSNNAGFSVINNQDVGIYPGLRSSVTGFPPATIVGGAIYAADDIAPPGTPAMLAQAKLDLVAAYLFAEGATNPAPATVSGDQGGLTLAPGIYKSTSTLLIQNGNLTLDGQGNPNATWIFQIASAFTTVGGAGGSIILTGGAQAKNIFWQTGSSAVIGDYTTFYGNVLALQSITMNAYSTAVGRMLAQNGAVVMTGTNTINKP